MNFPDLSNLIPAVTYSLLAVLNYFILILAIDIGLGVIRSWIASIRKDAAGAFKIKPFNWDYLLNFARTQLLSPPVAAVAGALFMAPFAPSQAQGSIYAVISATIFAQSLVLTRDVFNKIRELASLITFQPATLPAK